MGEFSAAPGSTPHSIPSALTRHERRSEKPFLLPPLAPCLRVSAPPPFRDKIGRPALRSFRRAKKFVGANVRGMNDSGKKDPLHGLTLEAILLQLVERYGWEELGRRIDIRCFNFDPSIKSSLKFLRRTPWARKKVEELYLQPAP